MAFREFGDWSGPNTGVLFANGTFNVDMAVGSYELGTGRAAANRVPDMQLVYYFLFVIYRDGNNADFPRRPGEQFNIPPAAKNFYSPDIKVRLSKRIWRFQTDLLKRGLRIFRDGRCDRANGKLSSISKTRYTIHYCNFVYAKTIKEKYNRTDWQDYMLADPMLPHEVRAELLASSVMV